MRHEREKAPSKHENEKGLQAAGMGTAGQGTRASAQVTCLGMQQGRGEGGGAPRGLPEQESLQMPQVGGPMYTFRFRTFRKRGNLGKKLKVSL